MKKVFGVGMKVCSWQGMASGRLPALRHESCFIHHSIVVATQALSSVKYMHSSIPFPPESKNIVKAFTRFRARKSKAFNELSVNDFHLKACHLRPHGLNGVPDIRTLPRVPLARYMILGRRPSGLLWQGRPRG